jgi:hypothetical protein
MSCAVSCWHLTAGAQFQSEASPCGIYGGQSGTRTSLSVVSLVLLCHYHFIMLQSQLLSCLLSALNNICNWQHC